jgi:hypothetical protein
MHRLRLTRHDTYTELSVDVFRRVAVAEDLHLTLLYSGLPT